MGNLHEQVNEFHHHVSSSPLCELCLWVSKHCLFSTDQTTKPQTWVSIHMPWEISFLKIECHLFLCILTFMFFFLSSFQTHGRRRPHVSESYKPNNASRCSPFHQGYTDEHQVPWRSRYAWQSLSQLYFAEYRTGWSVFCLAILEIRWTTLIAAHVHLRIIVDYYPHLIVL